MPKGRRDRLVCFPAVLLLLASVALACGSSAPFTAKSLPEESAAQSGAVERAGRFIYRQLTRADFGELLVDDIGLRSLVSAEAASRYSVLRGTAALGVESADFRPFREARYAGICLQSSREEPAHTGLGLKHKAWVFDRALVVGAQPGGRRLAAWVEGAFVYTSKGFRALSLSRVEAPRWEHSDLELLGCDVQVGMDRPHPVVVVTE